MWQLVGIGSNIRPVENVARALMHLARQHDRVALSRAVWTEPAGIQSEQTFINLAVLVPWRGSARDLKYRFNSLETALGRDRTDPMRKLSNRPIDLDILCAVGLEETPPALDAPLYMVDVVEELLDFFWQRSGRQRGRQETAFIPVGDVVVGDRPAVLHLDEETGYTTVCVNKAGLE